MIQLPESVSLEKLLDKDKVKVIGFKKSPLTDKVSEIATTAWSTDG